MFDVSSSQQWLWNAVCPFRFLGAAKERDDLDVVAATMSKPGLILRRPAGSDGPFKEHADLPIQRRIGAQSQEGSVEV
jgi:hypothetical protein